MTKHTGSGYEPGATVAKSEAPIGLEALRRDAEALNRTLTDGTVYVPVVLLREPPVPARVGGLDEAQVRLYADVVDDLPPIDVQARTNIVGDGLHRVAAHRRAGRELIRVRYHDWTDSERFLHSVKANVTHGLPASAADRARNAREILRLQPNWSDARVADWSGASARSVFAYRQELMADASVPETVRRQLASDVLLDRSGRLRKVNRAALQDLEGARAEGASPQLAGEESDLERMRFIAPAAVPFAAAVEAGANGAAWVKHLPPHERAEVFASLEECDAFELPLSVFMEECAAACRGDGRSERRERLADKFEAAAGFLALAEAEWRAAA